jgi:hypothetical protein
MKVLFLISNYKRKDMLTNLVKQIQNNGFDYFIVDDKSDYDLSEIVDDTCKSIITTDKYVVNEFNYGKNLYYKTFTKLMQYCITKTDYDYFIFTPNDFVDYDFDILFKYANAFKDDYFMFNIINDGRTQCWNHHSITKLTNDIYRAYYCDCGFITNYKTLKVFNFTIPKPPLVFEREDRSSGVGYYLTTRGIKAGVNMYLPVKSLALHGEHDSVMHYEQRKKDILKSK